MAPVSAGNRGCAGGDSPRQRASSAVHFLPPLTLSGPRMVLLLLGVAPSLLLLLPHMLVAVAAPAVCERSSLEEPLMMAAARHMSQHHIASAIACYEAAEKSAQTTNERFGAVISLAAAELARHDVARAVVHLQRAQAMAGSDVQRVAALHNGLAEVQLQLGNLMAAAESYEHAYTLIPEDTGAAIGVALVYEALGRHEEALSLYTETLEGPVESAVARVRAAHLLCTRGEFSSARRLLEHGSAADGLNGSYQWLVLAEALAGEGNVQKALKIAEDVFKAEPESEHVSGVVGGVEWH